VAERADIGGVQARGAARRPAKAGQRQRAVQAAAALSLQPRLRHGGRERLHGRVVLGRAPALQAGGAAAQPLAASAPHLLGAA